MTEETAKRWPCTLIDGKLEPCWALDEMLQEPFSRGTRQQGVFLHHMIDVPTGKFTRHLVSIKSGKHNKKGVFVNLCPFCGSKLLEAEDVSEDTGE